MKLPARHVTTKTETCFPLRLFNIWRLLGEALVSTNCVASAHCGRTPILMASGRRSARRSATTYRDSRPLQRPSGYWVAKDSRERLRRDREALRKDLRRAKIEVLLDKESAVGLIAARGLGAGGALLGGLVGGPIGALIGL